MTQTPGNYTVADIVRRARETMIRSAEARQALEIESKKVVYRSKAANDQLRAQLQAARAEEEQAAIRFNELFRAHGHAEAAERRQKHEQALSAEREKRQQERAQQAEASAKSEHRDRYISNGGTAQQFEKSWPSMWEKILVDSTLEGKNESIEAMKASGLYGL